MLGERIKKLRQQKGYSITELADHAGVSKSYLSYIERNLQNNPSLQILSKIAAPLNTTIDELLDHTPMNSSVERVKDRRLDQEWKALIERTITEGVSTGEFEVVHAKQASSEQENLPKVLKRTSNIIILL